MTSILLHDLLGQAAKSDALGGEAANIAEGQFTSAFGDDGASKTFEQFRLGALQAVEAFGPGNYLAAITGETTFSFADLKSKKLTCYLIIDYANKDVLGKFAGLMQWLAAYHLVHVGNNKPILFVLEEFCYSPLHTLPTILTLLRTYGVKCVQATQDLDDIVRVYSKHALESVLSETEIKQYLGGIKSQTTLEYLSKALGETSEASTSYSIGRDGVQESMASAFRRLLTEEEIRRRPSGAQIIFYKNLRSLLARKVQIFVVHPWRKKLAPNSLYGGKMKYLPVEVRVGWFDTRVTERGRKAYRAIIKEMRKRPSSWWRFFEDWNSGTVRSPGLAVLAAIAISLWFIGCPHLKWEYAFEGPRDAPTRYVWCSYVGPEPVITHGPDRPLIIFCESQ